MGCIPFYGSSMLSVISQLQRLRPRTLGCEVGGAWTREPLPARFEQVHPASGESLGEIVDGGVSLVDRAVAAARRAFYQGPWPHTGARERRIVLQRIAGLITQ